MAVDVTRQDAGNAGPGPVRRLMDFYQGVMTEMRKVTWPDRAQVRSATIAIILFVMALALVITLLDTVLDGILVRFIPSLFTSSGAA